MQVYIHAALANICFWVRSADKLKCFAHSMAHDVVCTYVRILHLQMGGNTSFSTVQSGPSTVFLFLFLFYFFFFFFNCFVFAGFKKQHARTGSSHSGQKKKTFSQHFQSGSLGVMDEQNLWDLNKMAFSFQASVITVIEDSSPGSQRFRRKWKNRR